MKHRKNHRAKPGQSIRHALRRKIKGIWLRAYAANPLNRLTSRQLTLYNRMEADFLKGKKRKKLSADEREMILGLATAPRVLP